MTGGWAAIPASIARDPSIHYGAKALFMALASYADEHGRAWPSQATLAADTGMGEGTVKRHLTALRDAGLLSWEVRSTERGRQRFYTVWRPGADLAERQGVGSPGGGGRVSDEPMGRSTSGTEQEPGHPEPQNHDAPPSGDGALMSIEDAGGAPPAAPMPTGRDLFAAWVDGYAESHGHPHDPAINGQLSGRVREAAKSRSDLASWRHAWRAFKAAGRDGSVYVQRYLLDPSLHRQTSERQAVASYAADYDDGYASTLPPPPRKDLFG